MRMVKVVLRIWLKLQIILRGQQYMGTQRPSGIQS